MTSLNAVLQPNSGCFSNLSLQLPGADTTTSTPIEQFLKNNFDEIAKSSHAANDFFSKNFKQLAKTTEEWQQLHTKISSDRSLKEEEKAIILTRIQDYISYFETHILDHLPDDLIQKIILVLGDPWTFYLLNHRLATIAKDATTSTLFLKKLCKRWKVKFSVLKAGYSSLPFYLKDAKDPSILHRLRKNQINFAKDLKIDFPKNKGLLALQREIEENLTRSKTQKCIQAFIESIKYFDFFPVFSILASFNQVHPTLPETGNLDRAKAQRFDNREGIHTSDIESCAIVASRKLSPESKSKFPEESGINEFDLLKIIEGFFDCSHAWRSNGGLPQGPAYRLYDLALHLPQSTKKTTFLSHFVSLFLNFQDVKTATEAANAIQKKSFKDSALIDIVEHLAKKKEVPQAFKVVNTIHGPDYQTIGLCVILAIKGEIDQAKEKANAILDDNKRSSAFYKIANILTDEGKVDLAREFTDRIVNQHKKAEVLERIVLILIKNDQLEQAEEVANIILEEPYQSGALDALSRAFVRKGNFDQANKIAERISNEKTKLSMLEYSQKFRGNLDQLLQGDKKFLETSLYGYNLYGYNLYDKATEAITLANALPDDHAMKSEVWDLIKKVLIKWINIGGTNEVAPVMKESAQTKSLVFQAIAAMPREEATMILKSLVNVRQLDLAIEFANTIKEEHSRYEAIEEISSFLAECGEIDQAVQVVTDTISDPFFQSHHLHCIALRLAHNYTDQAREIANRISNARVKSSSLTDITRIVAIRNRKNHEEF